VSGRCFRGRPGRPCKGRRLARRGQLRRCGEFTGIAPRMPDGEDDHAGSLTAMKACHRTRPTGRFRSGWTPCLVRWRPARYCRATLTVDVAIAGAGLTGLWTAYYLATAQARAAVHAVCEAEIAASASPAQRRLVPRCSRLAEATHRMASGRRGRDVPGHAGNRRRGRPGRRGRDIDCTGQGRTVHWPGQRALTAPGRGRRDARLRFGEEDLTLLPRTRPRRLAPPACWRDLHPHCAAIHPRAWRRLDQVVRNGG